MNLLQFLIVRYCGRSSLFDGLRNSPLCGVHIHSRNPRISICIDFELALTLCVCRFDLKELKIPLRYSLLDDRYVEVAAGQAAQRGEVCGECSRGCILTITTTISKLHHIAFCPSIQTEHPSCRNDRICCASVSASVVQSCCHFDHKQTEQMRRILPSIHQSISSQTFPTQAPTTSGPSLRFEILIRDATPMRTMARMRQPRTIGSTDISALLFVSLFLYSFLSCSRS
jgi:hypothetical protein